MRTVGIKQLKARLSEYVRAARQGEVFLVTDRDTVVAELRAPGSSIQSASKPRHVREVLADLAATGDVMAPTATIDGWHRAGSRASLPVGTAASIMDELRADRDTSGE